MTKRTLENAAIHSKHWHKAIEKKVLSNPKSHESFERTRQEIEISMMMRKTREKEHLSQETIATRMQTTRTAVSRLESCGSGQRHSPSIQTLLKYAYALGYTLKICLVPPKRKSHQKMG